MNQALERVRIERLGRRGEGLAQTDDHPFYVPYALPGEVVTVDRERRGNGERATLIGIVEPSPDRVEPICPYFTTCGGCAVQALAPTPYATWKRELLSGALARAGLTLTAAALVDAHGSGRRRATFHARNGADGVMRVGFSQARGHAIVPIDVCPILDPAMAGALLAANALAQALAESIAPQQWALRKPLDLLVTASDAGLDIDLRGHGTLSAEDRDALAAAAIRLDLARVSNHGVIVLEREKPVLMVGRRARVELPTGAFLQATAAGEEALAARVIAGCAGIGRVADLFCGIGTFALRLADTAEVLAVDSDAAAVAALDRAARTTSGLRSISTETRDLFRRPLSPAELERFGTVVIDPPRAGAEAQMRALAASKATRVVSVSCDAQSFARDAAILLEAGFRAKEAVPIDQFRYAAHLEIVAVFDRPARKRARRLLG